jgi:hypothetical protein
MWREMELSGTPRARCASMKGSMRSMTWLGGARLAHKTEPRKGRSESLRGSAWATLPVCRAVLLRERRPHGSLQRRRPARDAGVTSWRVRAAPEAGSRKMRASASASTSNGVWYAERPARGGARSAPPMVFRVHNPFYHVLSPSKDVLSPSSLCRVPTTPWSFPGGAAALAGARAQAAARTDHDAVHVL